MPTHISLNFQVYQVPESVVMTQRVRYFLYLGQSYFYRIKKMWWVTDEYLQWSIYVKTKSHVYMCIKKLAKIFPGLLIPHQVSDEVYLSCLYFIVLCILSISYSYPNTAVTVKGYYKSRFFNVHQSLWSPKFMRNLIIMKYSKAIRLTGK